MKLSFVLIIIVVCRFKSAHHYRSQGMWG